MDIIYSRELHNLLNDMQKFAEENKIRELNTIILLYALMVDPKFAKAVLMSTKVNLSDVEDTILDLAETWYQGDENKENVGKNCIFYNKKSASIPLTVDVSDDLKHILNGAGIIAIVDGKNEVDIDDVVESMIINENSNIQYFFKNSEMQEETFQKNYKSLILKDERWVTDSEYTLIIALPQY